MLRRKHRRAFAKVSARERNCWTGPAEKSTLISKSFSFPSFFLPFFLLLLVFVCFIYIYIYIYIYIKEPHHHSSDIFLCTSWCDTCFVSGNQRCLTLFFYYAIKSQTRTCPLFEKYKRIPREINVSRSIVIESTWKIDSDRSDIAHSVQWIKYDRGKSSANDKYLEWFGLVLFRS